MSRIYNEQRSQERAARRATAEAEAESARAEQERRYRSIRLFSAGSALFIGGMLLGAILTMTYAVAMAEIPGWWPNLP